jgi:peptide/nickel transport system substrate-binding protein
MNQQVPSRSRQGKRRPELMRGPLPGLVAVITALALAACGGSSSSSSSGSSAAAAPSGKPAQGGTIYYAHDLEPPCLSGGWVEENYIERQYADSVVAMAPGGTFVPWLATRWTMNKAQTVYTFYLKPGVKFTDGTPLNAAAVAYNFNYWVNPKTANGDTSSYLQPYFKSAVALNNLTVQVTLNQPYDGFLAAISQSYAGILSLNTLKAGAAAVCDHPVGSGAWIIQQWNHGKNVEFTRNPNYNSAPATAKHQGPAYASKLVWSFIADPTTRWGTLVSGQNNVIEDVPTIDFPTAKSQYEFEEYVTPGRPQTLELNASYGPFTNVFVRQAFAYASNRKQVVQSAFNGEIPYDGNGALSPTTPDYDAALNNAFPYNPAKAAQLLNEAGWTGHNSQGYRTKDGQELTIKLAYGAQSIVNDEGATALQDLQQQWKASGFNVVLDPETLTQLFSGSTVKSFDATVGYWTSPTPAVLYIVWQFWNGTSPNGNNNTFYDNQDLVKTIAAADSALTPAQQQALYYKAQQIIVNQAVDVGIYTKTTTLASSPKLRGVWIEASQGDPVFSDAYLTS